MSQITPLLVLHRLQMSCFRIAFLATIGLAVGGHGQEIDYCSEQSYALYSCMSVIADGAAKQELCEVYLSDVASDFSCESNCTQENSDICKYLPGPHCPDDCFSQVEAFESCMANERRSAYCGDDLPSCPPLDCDSDSDVDEDNPTVASAQSSAFHLGALVPLVVAIFVVGALRN